MQHAHSYSTVPGCHNCERPIKPGEFFCAACGEVLTVHWVSAAGCEHCCSQNPVGFRFCVECGQPAAQRRSPSAYARTVTDTMPFRCTTVVEEVDANEQKPWDEFEGACMDFNTVITGRARTGDTVVAYAH